MVFTEFPLFTDNNNIKENVYTSEYSSKKDDTKSVYFLKGSFKNFFVNNYNTGEKLKEV